MVRLPTYKSHIDSIESVETLFLLFALRGLRYNTSAILPPYDPKYKVIDLPFLQTIRKVLGVTFIFNMINAYDNSSFLLGLMDLHVRIRRTRNYDPIELSQCYRKYE